MSSNGSSFRQLTDGSWVDSQGRPVDEYGRLLVTGGNRRETHRRSAVLVTDAYMRRVEEPDQPPSPVTQRYNGPIRSALSKDDYDTPAQTQYWSPDREVQRHDINFDEDDNSVELDDMYPYVASEDSQEIAYHNNRSDHTSHRESDGYKSHRSSTGGDGSSSRKSSHKKKESSFDRGGSSSKKGKKKSSSKKGSHSFYFSFSFGPH